MSKDKLQEEIRDMLRSYDLILVGLPEMAVADLRLVHKYLKKCESGALDFWKDVVKFDPKEFDGIAKLFDCRTRSYSEFHNEK